ncbi:hypothetical protein D3C72_1847430 [compost metagenome]
MRLVYGKATNPKKLNYKGVLKPTPFMSVPKFPVVLKKFMYMMDKRSAKIRNWFVYLALK